jgi:TolB-like protein/Flp pilus assembly protein TadD
MSFLGEIRRRKMFQVAAIYAVVAWVLVQIVATVEAPLRLPDWVDTLVIVLLAVSFPITLIISWVFNVTREGLVRDTGSAEPAIEAAVEDKDKSRIQLLPNSIAVLPFENLSPNPDDAYFSAGVHEQLLNELAKVRDINVIARTSVLQYATDPQPIPQIAKALNVETVMEGSVRYAGEKVRITAQLIDGTSGAHLWTEAYDGSITDVFAIQTDIATAIAKALEAELLPETRAQLEKQPTSSPAAYALFLEAGKYSLNNRWTEALPLLDRAIALDPEFADAYASKGYGGAWMLVSSFAEASSNPEKLRAVERDALDNANRALAIDDRLGAAWLVRATVNHVSWRWKSAEEDFERSIELSPNNPQVLGEYAMFKARKGEHEDALRMARQSAKLDPNALSMNSFLGMVSSISGDFEQSRRAAERLFEIAPGHPIGAMMLGHALVGLGDFSAATKSYRTAEGLITDDSGFFMPSMIYCYGLMGQADDANRLFNRFEAWSVGHNVGAGFWIYAYLGLRDADKAYEWSGRALEYAEKSQPDAGFMAFLILMSNAHHDPILEEPRFQKLFKQIDTIARSR